MNTNEHASNSWLRRAYHWTLAWADHPQAQWALFFIALIEASVFPIPPDILLLALALGRPDLAFRFASICTAGSTVGAAIGYAIGLFLFASIAEPLLQTYGMMGQFHQVESWFGDWGLWLVLIAGFSPIPFKVITIAAGAFGLPFVGFIFTALLSRGARFFLESGLLYWGGDKLRAWVERYFEWASLGIALLLILGFLGLWLLH
ncbi:MAG: YqaA family protein [Mariprofundaceae bacterium]|nr:YqaA family protein [Mariprofundaceae bacterium]